MPRAERVAASRHFSCSFRPVAGGVVVFWSSPVGPGVFTEDGPVWCLGLKVPLKNFEFRSHFDFWLILATWNLAMALSVKWT